MNAMEQNLKVGPKDVFLHLLAIITLYASAISLATLLFQYINLAWPDLGANSFYYRDGILSTVRFAVSTLIVVFPVYFWTSRLLRKMSEADPERRSFGIRKWLGYFTIFLAAAVAIGWLVGVINTFLNGDLTTAFILKALVIFFIAGSAFFYYRAVTQGTEGRAVVRNYGIFIAVVVLASVVAAFFVTGSPQQRRDERADMQRVSDLQNIQSQIGSYYQSKQQLPASFADLTGAFGDNSLPKDPVTQKDYEYSAKSPAQNSTAFELCADFSLASSAANDPSMPAPVYPPGKSPYGQYGDKWNHDAGHYCFERAIDKDYFKPASASLAVPVIP